MCVCLCLVHILSLVVFQLNKCLSANQKLWRDRVSMLEQKIDVTIKQKEKVNTDVGVDRVLYITL